MKYILLNILLINVTFCYSQEWHKVNGFVPNNYGIISLFTLDSCLLMSGDFTDISGLSVNHIAYMSSQVFSALGTGMLGQAKTYATYNNKIYFGGGFISAEGNSNYAKLATWDGSSWGGFGSAVATVVEDLEVYQGKLYGIGNFDNLFGVTGLNDVFQFDGTTFSDLNGGVSGAVASGRELDVYDDLLIAAGRFQSAGGVPVSNLAAWDGNNWYNYAGGTNAVIYAMITDTINEYLYISGDFTFVGDTLPVSYFARWDGQEWTSYDDGMNCGAFDMSMYQNQLYIGGCFDQAGDKPIKYIARYNGTEWDSLGVSINNQGAGPLAVFQGELYVGGGFTQIGDTVAPGLAKWSFPLDSACKDMYAGIGVHSDTLYTSQLPYTFRSGCYGNGSLLWQFSDGFTSPKGHIAYDFNNTPGTYNIMLTAQCGTYADTINSQVVIISNVGIENQESLELKIFPNPSDGRISIFSEQLTGQEVLINIYDIQGKAVYSKTIKFNSNTAMLDLNLSKGNYQLSLMSEGNKMTQTLVIE